MISDFWLNNHKHGVSEPWTIPVLDGCSLFERWNEMLKDQPDWLEVSLPPGSLQSLESNLASLGVTKEHAMGVFIDRIAEAVMKDSAVRIQ